MRYVWLILRTLGVAVALWSGTVRAERPGADYELCNEADDIFQSPDKKLRIEEYSKPMEDGIGGRQWQFWAMWNDGHHASLLNREPMEYHSASFRFSPDSRWLVRMQPMGMSYASLYLYRRHGYRFEEATPTPLSDLAWSYYKTVHRRLKLPADPKYHQRADLIRGYDTNYRWLGYHWPAGRYIVIGLAADNLSGFWCVYDTETRKFFLPATPVARKHIAELRKKWQSSE